ncbi:TIGR04168 family protein [Spirulina subsalsa FACHB-351]|uniref:TIGR04168 family protein n=1 Tax=Spirulina subsalsa FACHB-351 TaxID=234711 RepID=A0ABT3L2T0_9CYAN|nr:TIGR04168 family protein [Spirulina subsalsa FACHB-351]
MINMSHGLQSRQGVPQSLTIAVIGDIHEQWEMEDNEALEHLGVDLALFVGDFGNESLEVVGRIAQLRIPYAAILGNHDAWYTASEWGRKKSPYDHRLEDRVQAQLDLLGEAHVGFGKRDFPQLGVSVVGSRPFSWGGQDWKNDRFYRERYGIENFRQSAQCIMAAAQGTACETVIFLAHNGPLGLGDRAEDICGRDWQPLGGDFGDPDLAEAIAHTQTIGKKIPLVTFGHMHHHLRHTKARLRTPIQKRHHTVYLNAASVPRIRTRTPLFNPSQSDRLSNFSLVRLENQQVCQVSLIWADCEGNIDEQIPLYEAPSLADVQASSMS